MGTVRDRQAQTQCHTFCDFAASSHCKPGSSAISNSYPLSCNTDSMDIADALKFRDVEAGDHFFLV